MKGSFTSSAPGRLCLFGEHQDYLGLPVIAMAMNRRCRLAFSPVDEGRVQVTSAILGPMDAFHLKAIRGEEHTDPLRHALARLLEEFESSEVGGWHVHIDSDVPVRAGCSSSTALMTAWVAGWLQILQGGFDPSDVVRRSHRYEVLDFNGAGGDMDQFACGHGGLNRFSAGEPCALHQPGGVFVLGDSGQPKDTQGHLRRCRDGRIPLMPYLDSPQPQLSPDELVLLEGTKVNRDLEAHWAEMMMAGHVSGKEMGEGLTRHHAVLRDALGLSTPRIEAMLDAALSAGAWGGKINGSGGGGCCFALCPEARVEHVIEAMKAAGAAGAWRVEMDEGVTCMV